MNTNDVEGRFMAYVVVLSQYFPGGSEENHEKCQKTGVPFEPSTSE
jgi:hypothetical protein